jgi:hypothetical protein
MTAQHVETMMYLELISETKTVSYRVPLGFRYILSTFIFFFTIFYYALSDLYHYALDFIFHSPPSNRLAERAKGSRDD